MKKTLLLLLLAAACSTFTYAQKDPVRDFFKQYHNVPNAVNLNMQGFMIRLAANLAEEEEGAQLLKKVKSLHLLVLEDAEPLVRDDFSKLLRDAKGTKFEDLIQISKGLEKVNVMIREKEGTVTDVLIFVSGAEELVLLHLEGRLLFSDLNDLDIDMDGAEHLKSLPEKRTRA